MNKVFALTNEKSWKSVLVTNEKLLLINKSYDTPEDFLKGYEDSGLGRLLKEKKEIELFSITGLSHKEQDPTSLKIISSKNFDLEFAKTEDLKEVAEFIASSKKLKSSTQQMTPLKAIANPGIALLITAGIGWVIYTQAEVLEAGGIIENSGRRRLVKQLFIWLAETLGTKGTLLVAGGISTYCLYKIYQNYQTPPNEVVYE